MLNTSIIIFVLFLLAFGGFAAYDLATAKRRKEVYRVKSSVTAYLMLLPAVGLAFLFILLPILYSLGYAFTDYYLLKPNDINFVELQNFIDFFEELATKGKLLTKKQSVKRLELKVNSLDNLVDVDNTVMLLSKLNQLKEEKVTNSLIRSLVVQFLRNSSDQLMLVFKKL